MKRSHEISHFYDSYGEKFPLSQSKGSLFDYSQGSSAMAISRYSFDSDKAFKISSSQEEENVAESNSWPPITDKNNAPFYCSQPLSNPYHRQPPNLTAVGGSRLSTRQTSGLRRHPSLHQQHYANEPYRSRHHHQHPPLPRRPSSVIGAANYSSQYNGTRTTAAAAEDAEFADALDDICVHMESVLGQLRLSNNNNNNTDPSQYNHHCQLTEEVMQEISMSIESCIDQLQESCENMHILMQQSLDTDGIVDRCIANCKRLFEAKKQQVKPKVGKRNTRNTRRKTVKKPPFRF